MCRLSYIRPLFLYSFTNPLMKVSCAVCTPSVFPPLRHRSIPFPILCYAELICSSFFFLRLQCPGCPPTLCVSLTHSLFLLNEMVGHQTTGSPSLGLFCTYSDVYMSVCSCLNDCDFQFCWKPAGHTFVILCPSCLNGLGTRMFIL